MHPLPVIGVVEPGAMAAVATGVGGAHLVLATEATVRLGAYREAIKAQDASADVRELACELLVSLAEEGWTDGAIETDIVTRYLQPLVETSYQPDCVILGCTHFPLLREAIAGVVANGTVIVDSASTTAEFATQTLADAGLANAGSAAGALRLLATDGATRFSRVGGRFLGERLATSDIELVDL